MSCLGLTEERLDINQCTDSLRLLVIPMDPLDAGKERVGDEDRARVVFGVLNQAVHALVIPGQVVFLCVESNDLRMQGSI